MLSSLLVLAVLAPSSQCEGGFVPTYGGHVGLTPSDAAHAATVVPGVDGPELWVQGDFWSAGGQVARNMARWSVRGWEGMPTPLGLELVWSDLAVFRGQGFVGGSPVNKGPLPVPYALARWTGSEWLSLPGDPQGVIHALEVLDDGSGPALYAAGRFSLPNERATLLARYDGVTWTALATDPSETSSASSVAALETATGMQLVLGGAFGPASPYGAGALITWNGSAWRTFGIPLRGGATQTVVFDEGAGPRLVAIVWSPNGCPDACVLRWTGSDWETLGTVGAAIAHVLHVHEGPQGEELYAGGYFAAPGSIPPFRQLARWNGSDWDSVGDYINGQVRLIETVDLGNGPEILVGGEFQTVGRRVVNGIALYDGQQWRALGDSPLHPNSGVAGLRTTPTRPRVLVGASTYSTQVPYQSFLYEWSGDEWTTFATFDAYQLSSIFEHDDGTGPALHVAGQFNVGQGAGILRFDGATWSPITQGQSFFSPTAAGSFDLGNGPRIYAVNSNGWAAEHDGVSWNLLPSGAGYFVSQLLVHDFGNGRGLVAVGWSEAHAWDGAAWRDISLPGASGVRSALSYDDGSGAKLVLAGSFEVTTPSGVARYLAVYDGNAWAPFAVGVDGHVDALGLFDFGEGEELVAVGTFSMAGHLPVDGVASWNGVRWKSRGAAPGHAGSTAVRRLTPFVDENGPALLFSGRFAASPAGDSFVARYEPCVGSIGTERCTPSAPNSSGQPAWLYAQGSARIASNDVTLEARALPPQTLTFFLVSHDAALVPVAASGSGSLCLGGVVARLDGPAQIQTSSAAGEVTLDLDVTSLPLGVLPGDSLHFQSWYRDSIGGATVSSFSSSFEVEFL